MAFSMRSSKFRHVFGKPLKKDQCYDALRISRSSWDSKFSAVNLKFLAVITESGNGSAFVVIPLTKVGRLDINVPQVCGHKGPVFDIAWCPFDDSLIASCSDDTTVKIWQIPEDGLTEPMTECLVSLEGAQRRVTNIAWHPTANNILLSGGADIIVMWNLETGEAISEYSVPEQVYSLSFNPDGSMFAATFKDKYIRVFDSHTMDVIKETVAHPGSKPPQCAFLKNNKIFTTGFSRMSERQYSLWDLDTMESKPMMTDEIDSSNGVMHITYDPDVSMLYLVGKGDSVIRYYEVTEEDPYVHYLSMYQSSAPQKGGAFMPKRGLNVNQNEIARFYKLHNNGLCEVVLFTVPRKSELFQSDLFPDTASDEPSITADDFINGKNAPPKLMSLNTEGNKSTKEKKTGLVRKSTILSEKKPALDRQSIPSNGPGEPAVAASVLPPTNNAKTVTNSEDVSELRKEIEDLKQLVNKQQVHIDSLEKRVTELEQSNHTDEEEDGEVA